MTNGDGLFVSVDVDTAMISTILRERHSGRVVVVSLSADPLIPTLWAHYSENSGLVIGCRTEAMWALGVEMRRVLYSEMPPAYTPHRDNIVRLRFVDEERRRETAEAGDTTPGVPLLARDVELFELRDDWRELAHVLFVKGATRQYEREVQLLVDLKGQRHSGSARTRPSGTPSNT